MIDKPNGFIKISQSSIDIMKETAKNLCLPYLEVLEIQKVDLTSKV